MNYLMRSLFALTGMIAGFSGPAGSGQGESVELPVVLAPFYTEAEYQAPLAGTYELPAFGDAADGDVLDSKGFPQRLHDYLRDGKLVLLSFIYSTCSDINGCPLATAVMYRVQQKIQDDPQLRDRFRMISLSFDPTFDTPEVMSLYSTGFTEGGDWRFITTTSWRELQPILEGYDQSVIRDFNEKGNEQPSFSHILRVFLIDPEKRIRNIYSVSFLNPDLIINDAKTVLMGSVQMVPGTTTDAVVPVSLLSRPGDDKDGYESGAYQTRSLDVESRAGEKADLIAYIEKPPLGLPAMPQPKDNPITRAKVDLGRKLFFDRRLSLNDTFSCAMCRSRVSRATSWQWR